MDVIFIGLGDQGLPFAERILQADWQLPARARRGRRHRLRRGAGRTVRSHRHLRRHRRRCVAGCRQPPWWVRPGSIVAIYSTVLPETCRRLQETLGSAEAAVLDASVSGGRSGGVAGTLSVMVGGGPATFERVRPVFESFGSPQHLGPLDSGQVLKLLSNAMLMAHLRLAYDALELATTLGVESDLAREVLLQGSGGSAAMRTMIKFAELDTIDVRSMLDKDFDHFREVISGMTAGRTIDRLGAELFDRLATEMLS